MLDGALIAAHSLWVVGAALIVAVAGYAWWQVGSAPGTARRVGAALAATSWTWLGGLLVCLGGVLTSGGWPEASLWLALALWLVIRGPWRSSVVRRPSSARRSGVRRNTQYTIRNTQYGIS